METRKSLLFSVGAVAIAALLAATNAFAAPPTQCTTLNFAVNVQMQTANGDTSYTYSIANTGATTPNANKFFVFTKGRQVDGQGLFGDLQGTIAGSPSGVYLNNGAIGAANCPPSTAWTDKTDDGWCFTAISTSNQPKLTVSERFQPLEGTTSVILSCAGGKQSCTGGDTQICGPILGPTTPAAPTFQGSPLVSTTSHQTFANGCSYFVTAGERDNIITAMTVDPATPVETVCGPSGCQACAVDNTPNSCETDLGLVFCPPAELGRPPIQSVLGGTCYYPKNLKYPC